MVTDLRLGCIVTMCLEQGRTRHPVPVTCHCVIYSLQWCRQRGTFIPILLMSKWMLTEARLARL